MRKRKRTEVTIQTREVILVRRAPARTRAFCPACETQATMVAPEEAARIAGVSPRTIYRWVEAERVHYVENSEGDLRICSASLRET